MREIVEACLQKSFGFKLAHELILWVFGDTLGSLWRKHEGPDNVLGTYVHWLRHGTVCWNQDGIPRITSGPTLAVLMRLFAFAVFGVQKSIASGQCSTSMQAP